MTRSIIHIISSIVCLLLPIIFSLYMLWDMHQPKIGPVGDGKSHYFTFPQVVPLISCFLMGALNLPVAIARYRQQKRIQETNKDNEI
ncbi:hypothetical protein [Paenibacillus glycanilyticus]|uniref:DUF1648 domain-containing protein n=1 Tax=Paenibacillus glycanilyticus TaxID=126569 RepID=A0ABQ6G9E2_9BACL|nr:hypothetical protein [Paenibacillus glycanilyticus]GLX67242.1 hypothetical protein MU1_15870 [Paenibacillus glycanilyticus]